LLIAFTRDSLSLGGIGFLYPNTYSPEVKKNGSLFVGILNRQFNERFYSYQLNLFHHDPSIIDYMLLFIYLFIFAKGSINSKAGD
jgi:hypothetical protein